jgi:nucleoside-diphosphate-sugar epimerase
VIFGANGLTGRLLTRCVLDAGHSAMAVTRRPVDTYSVGTNNVVNTMRETGVNRLVIVSSTGAYPAPGRRHAPLMLRLFEPILTRTIGKTVYDDIRRMEGLVRESGLDWTIVRPSGLFDLPRATNAAASS